MALQFHPLEIYVEIFSSSALNDLLVGKAGVADGDSALDAKTQLLKIHWWELQRFLEHGDQLVCAYKPDFIVLKQANDKNHVTFLLIIIDWVNSTDDIFLLNIVIFCC